MELTIGDIIKNDVRDDVVYGDMDELENSEFVNLGIAIKEARADVSNKRDALDNVSAFRHVVEDVANNRTPSSEFTNMARRLAVVSLENEMRVFNRSVGSVATEAMLSGNFNRVNTELQASVEGLFGDLVDKMKDLVKKVGIWYAEMTNNTAHLNNRLNYIESVLYKLDNKAEPKLPFLKPKKWMEKLYDSNGFIQDLDGICERAEKVNSEFIKTVTFTADKNLNWYFNRMKEMKVHDDPAAYSKFEYKLKDYVPKGSSVFTQTSGLDHVVDSGYVSSSLIGGSTKARVYRSPELPGGKALFSVVYDDCKHDLAISALHKTEYFVDYAVPAKYNRVINFLNTVALINTGVWVGLTLASPNIVNAGILTASKAASLALDYANEKYKAEGTGKTIKIEPDLVPRVLSVQRLKQLVEEARQFIKSFDGALSNLINKVYGDGRMAQLDNILMQYMHERYNNVKEGETYNPSYSVNKDLDVKLGRCIEDMLINVVGGILTESYLIVSSLCKYMEACIKEYA